MADSITTTLTVGAISALAWIAYKHPKGFARIYWPLAGLTLVALVGVFSFGIGAEMELTALRPFLVTGKSVAENAAANSIVPDSNTTLIAFILWQAYLSILYWLPNILGIDPEKGGPG